MSRIKDVLIQQMQHGMKNATDCKHLIDSAKTKTKRTYYEKKLKKINELNLRTMMAIDKLDMAKEK